jgi:hypothetical protein
LLNVENRTDSFIPIRILLLQYKSTQMQRWRNSRMHFRSIPMWWTLQLPDWYRWNWLSKTNNHINNNQNINNKCNPDYSFYCLSRM